MKYTREQIKDTVEGLGYKYFTGDNYDVNIVGIRNSKTNGKITNKFDDTLTISFKDEDGNWHYNEYNWATALEGKTSTYVNKWSAGCQVIASNDDWMEFLSICQEAREHWGNSFSYTLIESKDIK